MTQITERTDVHATQTETNTLPSVSETVAVVTTIRPDINSDEVYEALRGYTEDIAISDGDYEAMLQRRMESDLHPSCREGNYPTASWDVDGFNPKLWYVTKWADGSVTVDNTDYFIS